MSKAYLLSDNYSSSKNPSDGYFNASEGMKSSVSNSFIKGQPPKKPVLTTVGLQHSAPLGNSLKTAGLRDKMDSSVVLPRIVK
jgi:hypothetical protein